MKFWAMRYKVGSRPVEQGVVEATGREKGEELGREWCVRNRARFISLGEWVLVSERDAVRVVPEEMPEGVKDSPGLRAAIMDKLGMRG